MTEQKIAWKPNAGPQTWVLQKIAREILFGGQRGGGKTDAGIVWEGEPVQAFPKYRGLVIRRNAVDLSDWISRAKALYINLGGEFIGDEFRFPRFEKNDSGIYEVVPGEGAIIKTGHLAQEDTYEKYQGHEYQRILIEELTHIPTLDLYLKLLGSCRSTIPGLKAQLFATTNPGNAGHRWVKKRFVDTAELFEREYTDEHGKTQVVQHGKTHLDSDGLTRVFVPSRVEDNPYLFEQDPDYVKFLNSLPGDLRKAWREGSWDIYEVKGAYYKEEMRRMRNQGRITKVPFDPAALVHTWWDLGNPENTSIGFFQQVGMEWHLIDHHIGGAGGIHNYVKILSKKASEFGYDYGNHWAPHDIEVKEFSTGKTRLETARKLGIRFKLVPGKKEYSLADGIDATRLMLEQLWIDETKGEYVIDALINYKQRFNQRLAQFEDEPEKDWASHPADMIRYWSTTNQRPFAKTSLLAKKKQEEDNDGDYDKYSLFK